MNVKRCAVIGSMGYIGKHMVYYLQNMGITPMCYDVVDCSDDNYLKVNLSDPRDVKKINLDVDYLFVFAGLTGTFNGFERGEDFFTVNELGLWQLLEAIRNSKFRPTIVFPSTRLVYKGQDKALQEDDTKETKTVYAVNKMACEGLLSAYHVNFDIPYLVFRICIPYGNLLSDDYSFGTVGFFIRQAKSKNPITLYGGGNIKRTFTHILDICYQIVETSFHYSSVNEDDKFRNKQYQHIDDVPENCSVAETFNVGGETLSLHDAAVIIANHFGSKVMAVDWPEKDLRLESGHTYFDDAKIKTIIGDYKYKALRDFTNEL